jgi:hypothetical protein
VFPVRCELGFSIPEDGILHSHRRANLKFYKTKLTDRKIATRQTRNMVKCILRSSFACDITSNEIPSSGPKQHQTYQQQPRACQNLAMNGDDRPAP